MRIRYLDFLRFMAVCFVMMRHFDEKSFVLSENYFYLFIQKWQEIGWIGVDLFFVLSGFLISGLIFGELDKTQSFDAKRFLIRRGFKIYPAFYFLILVTAVIFFYRHKLSFEQLAAELLYVQNYFPGIWNHTWSLAVEEHFYFLAAAVMFFVSKSYDFRKQGFLIGLIVLILGVNLLKQFYVEEISGVNRITYFTQLRIDALLFGVLLCYLHRYRIKAFTWWQTYVAPVIVIVLVPVVYKIGVADIFDRSVLQYGYTLLYLYFGNVLMVMMRAEAMLSGKIWALPVRLGMYSYSIYLWHVPSKFIISSIVKRYISLGYFGDLIMYVALSFIMGILFFHVLEKPFLKLRDHLFPGNIQPKVTRE